MSKKKTDNALSHTVKPENGEQGQPIRIQISTSDGSETADALEEIRGKIPAALQKNFNLGAFFKEVLQNNDADVAEMIRTATKDGRSH